MLSSPPLPHHALPALTNHGPEPRDLGRLACELHRRGARRELVELREEVAVRNPELPSAALWKCFLLAPMLADVSMSMNR